MLSGESGKSFVKHYRVNAEEQLQDFGIYEIHTEENYREMGSQVDVKFVKHSR